MVRVHAAELGFPPNACAELVIVVSELASNILKYGVKGSIELVRVTHAEQGVGILIVAQDETPPFELAAAVPDGHDVHGKLDPFHLYKRRGIGAGLGAVVRFTDAVEMERTENGKRLAVTRYVRRPKRP